MPSCHKFCVSMPIPLYKAVKAAADADNRKVSNHIQHVLTRWLEQSQPSQVMVYETSHLRAAEPAHEAAPRFAGKPHGPQKTA